MADKTNVANTAANAAQSNSNQPTQNFMEMMNSFGGGSGQPHPGMATLSGEFASKYKNLQVDYRQ